MDHGLRWAGRTRTWWVGTIAGLHLLVLPSLAFAEEHDAVERELIHLDYAAAPSCPPRDELVEHVRTYTSRWTLAEPERAARHFRLRLEPHGDRVVGTLEIVEDAEASAPRTIVGPDCETVARGMAIAMAVAIDPSAFLSPRSEDTEPEPRPIAPAPHTPGPPRGEALVPRPSGAGPAPSRFSADARFEMSSAVVPGLLPVVSAAVEVDPLARRGDEPPGRLPAWLRPSLALGLRQSLPREVQRSTVTTDFIWTVAVLRLCPVRFVTAGGRLELSPCVEGDVGVLRANARGSADARQTANVWIDGVASARITWTVAGPWLVGAAAGMVLPVTRNRFELSTRSLVSQAPRAGVIFGLSGGLRF